MKREVVVSIGDASGATPIAKLVQVANSFESSIYITKEGIKVNAKSIMGMMNLVLASGTVVIVDASGPDEKEALDEIESFLIDLGK